MLLKVIRELLDTRKSKTVELTGDLLPRGIAKTICDERTDFNNTFQHIYTQLALTLGSSSSRY
jgi:hypothetical protein